MPKNPNPTESYQNLLAKHNNDAGELALKLFGEAYDLREKNRELSAKLPEEGAVVLSKADSDLWKAFQDLGVDAKEIKKSLDRLPQLEKDNKELSQMEDLREVADLGLDGSKLKLSVLKDQINKFPELEISFKTEKDSDGTERKVAYVKPTKEDKEFSFSEFANEKFADYLPALKVSSEGTSEEPLSGNSGDPKPNGTSDSVFDRIRAKVKTAGSSPKIDIDARFGKAA